MTAGNAILESANRKIKKLLDEGKDPAGAADYLTSDEKKELFRSLAGIWKDKKDIDKMVKQIYEDRKNFKLRH